MKNFNILLLASILVLSLSVTAQKPKAYFGLSAGASLPLGDYALTDFDNSASGFAKTGFGFKLSYDYRLNYNFGIAATLILNSNPWDEDALMNEIKGDSIHSQLNVSTNSWGAFGVLAGPFLYLPIGDLISVDLRALIGFYNAYAPEVFIRGTLDSGEPFDYRLLKYNGIGFSYDLGTTFRLKVSEKKYLLLSADYLSATINYDDIETKSINGVITSESFKQRFSTLNIMAGIGVSL